MRACQCSATLTLYGGKLVPYLLDEDKGWALDVEHLRQQLATARDQGTVVRGMVVSATRCSAQRRRVRTRWQA